MQKSHSKPNVQQPVHTAKKHKPIPALIKITVAVCLIGLTISALGSGFNVTWMVAGTIAGAVGGLLIGLAVNRALAKKGIE